MSTTENSLEMNQINTRDVDETEPLQKDIVVSDKMPQNESIATATSIDIDSNGKKQQQHVIGLEAEFYETIFGIVMPFVFIGSPFNYCFKRAFKKSQMFMTSNYMKAYTWFISIFAHLILLFWLVRLAVLMIQQKHLSHELIRGLFILCYIVAGVVALDITWFHRKSLMEVLSNLIAYQPSSENSKYQNLMTNNIPTLKYYRVKFCFLRVLSYLLAGSLLVYYAFLIISILRAYTDTDPEGYTAWWARILEIITIYALFFFVASLFLLLALIWATQYKIKHLNLYIGNLISSNELPDVSGIEIVKDWYQNILKTVSGIDRVFCFYILAYIGLFFLGIIYFVGQILDLFKQGSIVHTVENVQFLSVLGIASLMVLILFYGLKEFTDVHEHSQITRSMLYNYALNTKPRDRTTEFYIEVDFVTQGLLSRAATFTILGHIELNRSFMAHLAVIIYTYAVLFHQFIQKPFIVESCKKP